MIDEMIGISIAIRCVRATVERFATSRTPLVLIGETGTGKSRLARIVAAAGPRVHAPFITIDGAAIDPKPSAHLPPGQSNSGDVPWAWAAAQGGTLFIDHVGETPAALQVQLARLLRRSDGGHAARPRVIVANQQRLERAVAMGTFSRALFARVHHLAIHLPALRHRPEDIPWLAEHFLNHLATSGQSFQLASSTIVRLQRHLWPGNIRELNNVLRRALVLAGTRNTLQPRDIVFDARGFAAQSSLRSRRMRPSTTP